MAEHPLTVVYDPATSLIVVDVQNDFADPKGSLYVRGAEEVLPLINQEIARARQAGSPVLYTQDWHPPSTPHFQKDGGTWPVHCVQDSWGADLHPALEAAGTIIRKGVGGEDGYSGFATRDPTSGTLTSETGLEAELRARGTRRVVIVGLATDYCVKETALDAIRLGFDTVVFAKATRAVDLVAGDGERALAAIRRAGGAIV
ncbi:isochorismatase family protein [Sorangium sp. So ce302]|uniref:isochorismatase family protein n=1 Tax=unclassified Sorangium TaxID=2621164 RepID=UPI003F5FE79D